MRGTNTTSHSRLPVGRSCPPGSLKSCPELSELSRSLPFPKSGGKRSESPQDSFCPASLFLPICRFCFPFFPCPRSGFSAYQCSNHPPPSLRVRAAAFEIFLQFPSSRIPPTPLPPPAFVLCVFLYLRPLEHYSLCIMHCALCILSVIPRAFLGRIGRGFVQHGLRGARGRGILAAT